MSPANRLFGCRPSSLLRFLPGGDSNGRIAQVGQHEGEFFANLSGKRNHCGGAKTYEKREIADHAFGVGSAELANPLSAVAFRVRMGAPLRKASSTLL